MDCRGLRTFSLSLVMLVAAAGGCGNQRPLHIVKSDAEFAFTQKNFDKAELDYQEYIRRRPDATDVRYELARTYIAAGRYKQAIEQLNILLDVHPLNDQYLDSQAEAMFMAEDREALTLLLGRAASERGRVQDWIRLGQYTAKMGNADEAQQALLTAAKLDAGKTVAPQRALADFYGSVGDRDRQVRRLRMAYYIEPANAELLREIRRVGEIPGPSFGIPPEEVQ